MRVTELLEEINREELAYQGICLEPREEYAIEYPEQLLEAYQRAVSVDPDSFDSGRGHHKTPQQRRYQQLKGSATG